MPQAENQTHENNPNSAMLKELSRAREEAKTTAKTGEGGNPHGQADELPQGSSPIEARSSSTEGEEETSEEASPSPEGKSGDEGGDPSQAAESEEPIRIGGQTFKTQREAFEYAERVERERELTEAHAAGIRETLEAVRQPTQPVPEPEDNFEERFYANPKEALKEVEERATQRALGLINQEKQRETLWSEFLGEYPDVRRKDAERILRENWDVIGKITDTKAGMKALAQKVREEYDEIEQMRKPRTVLSDKKQVVSPGGGAPPRVTPAKKDATPLSFAEQMRNLRGSR